MKKNRVLTIIELSLRIAAVAFSLAALMLRLFDLTQAGQDI